jgi:hypothetical protein
MEGESDKNSGVNGANIDESCTACHQYFEKKDECDGNYVPLTKDEEWILSQMRDVKARVVSVNKRLQELERLDGFKTLSPDEAMKSGTGEQAEWLEHQQQLDLLRQEWQELDSKRQEAAKFRMKILGHDD